MSRFDPVVLHDFAGYDVVEARIHSLYGCPVIRSNEKLALISNPMRHYSAGSVASYAIQCNDDPIEATRRAIENGHTLHWLNAMATCISSPPPPKGRYIGVEIGMVVHFEGRKFRIDPVPFNRDHIKLVDVSDEWMRPELRIESPAQ